MTVILRAVVIDKKEPFNVKVEVGNYLLIRDLLIKERTKIVNKFKTYKSAGLIGSISYPRNKTLQKEIDELVYKKRLIKDSIEKINKIFL